MQSRNPLVRSAETRPTGELVITARLRAETRSDHDAIEANPRMSRLTALDLGLCDYAAILSRMAGFHAPVERGLRRWAARFPAALDLEARLVKSDLLRQDLRDIGFAAEEGETEADGRFGAFPTIEAAWGCLYVVEGATLGGQIIARNLHAALGVTSDRGAAFHMPYGAATGARWQGFKAILTDEVGRGALDPDAIVAGAREAFAALDGWMSGDRSLLLGLAP